MIDLKEATDPDTNTEEGTLIDHSFRGAAAEFEQAYIESVSYTHLTLPTS